MAGRFEHEKRACEALRQLARTLPLLLLTHSKMEIRAASNKFLKGEWESLWKKCMAKGHARQDKLAAKINLLRQDPSRDVGKLYRRTALGVSTRVMGQASRDRKTKKGALGVQQTCNPTGI